MTDAELKELREALKKTDATNALLLERAVRSDAFQAGAQALENIGLAESLKELAIVTIVERGIPKTADGQLDGAKFREAVLAEAKRVGAAFSAATGGGEVRGLGSGESQPDPKIQAQEAELVKQSEGANLRVFESLMPNASKESIAAAAMGRIN